MWQKSIIAFCAVCNSSLVDNYIPFCGMAFSVMAFTLRHGSHRCTLTHKHQCIELLSTSWFSMVLNVNSLSPGASMHICRIVKRKNKVNMLFWCNVRGGICKSHVCTFTGKQWRMTSVCVFNCRTSLVCLLTPVLLNSK